MPTKAAFVAQFPTGRFLLSSLCAIIILPGAFGCKPQYFIKNVMPFRALGRIYSFSYFKS